MKEIQLVFVGRILNLDSQCFSKLSTSLPQSQEAGNVFLRDDLKQFQWHIDQSGCVGRHRVSLMTHVSLAVSRYGNSLGVVSQGM